MNHFKATIISACIVISILLVWLCLYAFGNQDMINGFGIICMVVIVSLVVFDMYDMS